MCGDEAVKSQWGSTFRVNLSPLVIHVRKESHDKLTVHAVGHATMAWDRIAKVFDVEGPLESGRKESAERGD